MVTHLVSFDFCTLQGTQYALKRMSKGFIVQARCWELGSGYSGLHISHASSSKFMSQLLESKLQGRGGCSTASLRGAQHSCDARAFRVRLKPDNQSTSRTCMRGLYSKWEVYDGIIRTHHSMIFQRFFEWIISMPWISCMRSNSTT